MTRLYDPIVLGDMKLSNRVFMAPLTRNRAMPNGVPGRLASTYYSQRASAGLIVSEATQISPMGKGHINTPCISGYAGGRGDHTIAVTPRGRTRSEREGTPGCDAL